MACVPDSAVMDEAVDAGPVGRARRILDALRLPWKVFEPHFTPEHGGDPLPVFGGLKAGSIRKMLSRSGAGGVRWRSSYERPFIRWLREEHHWAAPDDLFVARATGTSSVIAAMDAARGGFAGAIRRAPRNASRSSSTRSRLRRTARSSSSQHRGCRTVSRVRARRH